MSELGDIFGLTLEDEPVVSTIGNDDYVELGNIFGLEYTPPPTPQPSPAIKEQSEATKEIVTQDQISEPPLTHGATRSFEPDVVAEPSPDDRFKIKPEAPVQDVTATITDPLIEEKYKAVAQSESALSAGAKEAGIALTYGSSPVSKYRQEEHPVASTIGTIAGTIAPMLIGGSGAIKTAMNIPKVAQIANSGRAGKVAVNGILRAGTAAYDYLARHNEELFSEDEAVSSEAKKNLAINIAASLVSPIPETFLPSNLIQPFAQAATDVIVESIGQAATGDSAFDEEHLANTIISGVTSGLFGIADIKSSPKSVRGVAKKIEDVGFQIKNDRSEKLDAMIKESVYETQKPSKSVVIEDESPQFETKTLPNGIDVAVNVRKPPTETDLKLAEANDAEYIKGYERTSEPQQNATGEQRTGAISPNAKPEPTSTPTGEGAGGKATESEWTFGDTREDIVSALAETRPETFDSLIDENVSAEIDRLSQSEALPVRKRGFALETGAIGEKDQVRLPDIEDKLAKSAEKKFDKQDEDIKSKFVLPFKQKIRNIIDKTGEAVVDRSYYAKRLLGEEGDKVIAKYNAVKGHSAEAKEQYSNAESNISKNLPHDLEKIFPRYLQAKRTIEIEGYKGEGKVKHTGGMTLEEANAYVNQVENRLPKEQSDAIVATSKKYWDEMQGQLKQLYDEGIISKESYDNLIKNGKNYSPREYIQHIDPDAPQGTGVKVGVSESGIKNLDEGSDQAMLNNWRLLLAEKIARTQARIAKNRAAKELLNFVKDNPENGMDLRHELPKSRKLSLDDATSIAENLQGDKLKLEQRLKNPLTQEQILNIENKITSLENKIDDLIIDKDMSEVDTDIEISELQKRSLDLNNILLEGENKLHEQKITKINKKIEALSKYPRSDEFDAKIKNLETLKSNLIDKMKNPISGTQIFDLEKKIGSLSDRINKWTGLIDEANKNGLDEITFLSKQYNKVPVGYERIMALIDGKKNSVLAPTKFAGSWNQNDVILNRSLAKFLNIASGSFLLRPMATGVLAPEFALSNIFRDASMQWLTTKEYNTFVPVAVAQTARNMIKVAKDAWTGKGRYRDYIKQGGGMEYLTEQGAMFRDPTKIVTPTTERNRQIVDAMNKLQQFSERLGRLSLREQAIKNGKTPEEATRIAREYLDFSQGGSWSKALDNAVPYLNASIQGTRSLARSFKRNPIETSLKASQLMIMGASAAYMANQYRKDTWEDIGDREKVTRWNFPLPWQYKNKEGKTVKSYLSIPKDQSARLFSTIGEVFVDRKLGNINGNQAWRRIKMALGDINPIDFIGLVPPTLSAIIGYSLNKDFWTKEDIWKGRRVSPHLEFYQGKTSKAAVDFASLMSSVGIEVSPARIESGIGQVMPATPVSALMGGTYDQISSTLKKEDREILDKNTLKMVSSLPGVRKFLRNTYPSRIDNEKLVEDIKKYKINYRTPSGEIKNKKVIQDEIYKAKLNIEDIKQADDAELIVVSELLKSGNRETATKKWNELRSSAVKVLGSKEIDRLNKRFKTINK